QHREKGIHGLLQFWVCGTLGKTSPPARRPSAGGLPGRCGFCLVANRTGRFHVACPVPSVTGGPPVLECVQNTLVVSRRTAYASHLRSCLRERRLEARAALAAQGA